MTSENVLRRPSDSFIPYPDLHTPVEISGGRFDRTLVSVGSFHLGSTSVFRDFNELRNLDRYGLRVENVLGYLNGKTSYDTFDPKTETNSSQDRLSTQVWEKGGIEPDE